MLDDNRSTDSEAQLPSPQSLYRGLYVRIAGRLGVDPSYVSRVARGERRSAQVEMALRDEIDEISKKLGSKVLPSSDKKKQRQAGTADKRIHHFVQKSKSQLRQNWLQQAHSDPHIRTIKLSPQKRGEPFLPLLEEQLKLMKFAPKELAVLNLRAAVKHGKSRRAQGYDSTALVEEYNLLRRCVFSLAEEKLPELDPRMLIRDMGQLGEVLDLQIQSALRHFLKPA